MDSIYIKSIQKELLVEVPRSKAFRVFTERMDTWWPKTHHIGKTPMTRLVLECVEGGRWYSCHEDGSEADIGYVQVWQPDERLVLIWQINGDFQCDPSIVSAVEVQFIAEGPDLTRVKLEHRDLEQLGGNQKTPESMDRGWGMILDLYKNILHHE
jgi:uncharacterized protein YndB with AHSA1/START domain